MPRRDHEDDDWDDRDNNDWAESDEEFDSEDYDEVEPTIDCPYCQAEIHEDSQRCPFCENYLSREDSPSQRRPLWLIVGVVICLILVLLWILP